MTQILVSVVTIIFVNFQILPTDAKIVEGSVWAPNSNFHFLSRFCFQEGNDATLEYEIRYPESFCLRGENGIYQSGCQKLVLYYDEKDQWDFVYKNDKVECQDKLDPNLLHYSQIINLDPMKHEPGEEIDSLYKYSMFVSGCWLTKREDTNASEIACRAKRNFLSQRDRWWFVALVNCETDKGLKLDYFHLEFKNGDSYNKHFSVDEWYIMETTFVLLYLFIILLIACIVFTIKLKNMGFYHITFKLFTLSLLLKVISYLLYAWAYLKYRTGYESIRIKNLALGFSMLAHIFLIFLVILMAKGYTITRAKLSTKGTFKVMLFIIIFTLIYFVSFVYHVNVFDPGEVLYFYESPPGYTTLGLQILSSFMISYGVFFTVKRYPEKLKFYLPFYVFYSAWILVTPIFAIFSIFVLQDFYRQKIVYGVEGGLAFLSYGFFLILTFPTRANKNFPYHIKTNQIDILEITETGNFPHEPDGQSESSYASSAASGETVTVSVSSRSAETNFIDVFRVDYDMVDPNNRRE